MSQTNRRPAPQGKPNVRPARPQPQARPGSAGRSPAQSSAQGGGRIPWREVAIIAAAGIAVAALALMLQIRWPNGFPLLDPATRPAANVVRTVSEIHADGPLRINEIMSANRGSFATEDGATPDWVEIANTGNSAVNLQGWSLAKTEGGTGVFHFPNLQLEPGECALVLADSRLREDATQTLHAPFRLSSGGDTLMLFNAAGTAVDTVNIPAVKANCSYLRAGIDAWEQCSTPTPGLPNDANSYRLLTEPSGDSPVVLSEIVASNDTTLQAKDGMRYDYIELHNRSDEAVNLRGWGLSDDAAEIRKWSFPDVTIEAGGYLLVFASGLNRRDDPEELHANFGLRAEGETVCLSDDAGRMMDRTSFELLKADAAWALGADGSWGYASPSPGRAN